MIWKLNETDIKFERLRVRKSFGKKLEIMVMSVRWVVKLNHCDGVYYRLIAMEKKIAKLKTHNQMLSDLHLQYILR